MFLIGATVRAQIAVYSFSGNTTSATSSNANVGASVFSGSNSPSTSNSSPVFSAGSGSFAISQAGWTGSAPGSNYFEFTLTPASGYSVGLTSISFGSRSTSTGPTNFNFRSSSDSFVGNLNSGSLINDSNWYASGSQSVSLTFSSATTFRLYASGASNAGGTFRVDDFTVNGSVTAVPEPASVAAVFGGAALVAAMLLRRSGIRRIRRV